MFRPAEQRECCEVDTDGRAPEASAGEVLHIRNVNSVVFWLDALARNSNGRHGGALGTAAGAASLRAATYRTDATRERALNSPLLPPLSTDAVGFRSVEFHQSNAAPPVAIASGACRLASMSRRSGLLIAHGVRAAMRQRVSLGGRVPDEFQVNIALTVDPLVRAEV
jgi:hypothetical protein